MNTARKTCRPDLHAMTSSKTTFNPPVVHIITFSYAFRRTSGPSSRNLVLNSSNFRASSGYKHLSQLAGKNGVLISVFRDSWSAENRTVKYETLWTWPKTVGNHCNLIFTVGALNAGLDEGRQYLRNVQYIRYLDWPTRRLTCTICLV
jgi:hypothetical protein